MKYIEIIILINLIIHISIVRLCLYILRQKPSYIFIFLSVVADIVYVILYLLMPYEVEAYKYVFIFLISALPFLNKEISKTLTLSSIYLMLNFMLGGMSEQLYLIINNFFAVILGLFLIYLVIFIVFYSKKFKNKSLYYEILITDNKKRYKLVGYCDTGNFLTDENNIPIVFINKKIKVGKYKKNIIVNTVSLSKELRLYEVDSFLIKINKKYIKKDVYLAYGDISFMVLFGLDILGG